jgi:uncharacterized protein (DUF169 family)
LEPLKTDLSIFKKFNFEHIPIGVKFAFSKPEGFETLDKKLAICEMLNEVYRRKTPFYFTKEQEDCFGKTILGMTEDDKPFGASGVVGYKWGLFQEPRANGRLYHHNYHLGKGVVNYVVFSPFDQLTFDPDLLVLMVKPNQSEIILRAMSYSSGELYESRLSSVLGCSWLYTYPYMTGKVNYFFTDLQTHGMRGRQVFPDGWVLISIPFNWIPTLTQSLKEMKWDLPEYTAGREYFLQERERILGEITQEFNKK